MNREELLKKAKPILFNTEMVQAILEGKKTVTRRIIKENVLDRFVNIIWNPNENTCFAPYRVGDILYVRETWQSVGTIYKFPTAYIYKASPEACPKHCPYSDGEKWIDLGQTWRPSIHMPKEASRIFLKVKNVRVEKLRNITYKEAKKEGVKVETNNSGVMHIVKFIDLWNSTIKKQDLDKYGWEANPWVFVISFERTFSDGGI